jgi:hypothetical protein
MSLDYNYFTLVFEGDIRRFDMNPLATETPWGVPCSVSVGDAIDELEIARVKLENIEQIIDPK